MLDAVANLTLRKYYTTIKKNFQTSKLLKRYF